ncbi:MAG TPA: tellurite resistance TerB family protein [Myxococcales bacterium]|nr:tellurite resistance TerB family protein [Myxococcales bacterium]
MSTLKPHVHFGDKSRQAAMFETMILAAAADGRVDRVEVEEIYRRVFERPEFHGIHASDLKEAIEHAAKRVAEAHSLEHILPSIVDRLPDKASRELAFGLAASVVVADGKTPPAEMEILKALQDMFDLSEEDVARLFETAQAHGQFPPTNPSGTFPKASS